MSDETCGFMTAGQLMAELAKLPADMKVDFAPIGEGIADEAATSHFRCEVGVGSPELFGADGRKPTDDNKPHSATFWTYDEAEK